MGNLRNLCHHGTDRNAQACGKCAVEKLAEALLQRRGLDAVAVMESNCLYNLVGEDNIQQLDKRAWVILFDVAKDLVEAESREQAMRECLSAASGHLDRAAIAKDRDRQASHINAAHMAILQGMIP